MAADPRQYLVDALSEIFKNPEGAIDSGLQSVSDLGLNAYNMFANPELSIPMAVSAASPWMENGAQVEESGKMFAELLEKRKNETRENSSFFKSPNVGTRLGVSPEANFNKGMERAATENLTPIWESIPENARESIQQYASDPRVAPFAQLLPFAGARIPIGRRGKPNPNNMFEVPANTTLPNPNAKAKVGGKQEGVILPFYEAVNRATAAGKPALAKRLKMNHIKAIDMQRQDATPLAISTATGFHPIPMDNGKEELFWEVEGKSKPTLLNMEEGYYADQNLGHMFENELLFDLMPEVRDTKVVFDADQPINTGSYDKYAGAGKGLVTVGVDKPSNMSIEEGYDNVTGTGVHEMTHASQKALMLPQGGNSRMFDTGRYWQMDESGFSDKELKRKDIVKALMTGVPTRDIADSLSGTGMTVTQELLDNSADQDAFGTIRTGVEGAKDFLDNTQTAEQKYKSLWGEASAFIDEQRNKMSDTQRKQTPYAQQMADFARVYDPSLLRIKRSNNRFDNKVEKVDSFTSNPRTPNNAFYDDDYATLEPKNYKDEDGNIIGEWSEPRLKEGLANTIPEPQYPPEGWRRPSMFDRLENPDLPLRPPEPEFAYRGMSSGEYENFLKTGKIKSKGEYNFSNQEGLTYFTKDPRSSVFYANSFAPKEFVPTFDKPAYVVKIKMPDKSRIKNVHGVAAHELGIIDAIDKSEVIDVYKGKVASHIPESDTRSGSSKVFWESVGNPNNMFEQP